MLRCLLYSIGILENKRMLLYEGLDGEDMFTFHELIAINPHNLEIIHVYCFNTRFEDCRIDIYGREGYIRCTRYAIDNVHDILDYVDEEMTCKEFNQDERNEVLHVIDLWITKFVPHHHPYYEKMK